MARGEDLQITTAKRAYHNAKAEGNRQEEARWANVIGDILKNRGEYVKALKWCRIDYEISNKYLPEKQLLPTCQSLGEVYLRLENYQNALIFQKKHLNLAENANDLVEQQRASTQLGRTYHEMFLKSDNDYHSVCSAKKYFKSAMKLAQVLKDNPPNNRSSFLKEYIDAHNNIGMLELDLDNLDNALKFLTKGLEICNEEEVSEHDDGRSRLHHNLGNVYLELREWDKAREHIEKDILICKRIGHCQGEAKGYINLGELHYRIQMYEDAINCYQKALDLAKSMEDEDALVAQSDQNIRTVKEAINVMNELKTEEQNLKKLTRNILTAKGTPQERKLLLQKNLCLDRLIDKSAIIFAWPKHLEFAKMKMSVASELCDKEKMSDAFLVVGESYQKSREFGKAIKWYTKSWDGYKSIGNMEGQALAKINIGDVLDCEGDWSGALEAFEEGFRIAVKAKLPSVQLSALENMHYSYMIRFHKVEEARKLQLQIDALKNSKIDEPKAKHVTSDCCSETDTEGDDHSSDMSNTNAGVLSNNLSRPAYLAASGEINDDLPLISLIRPRKISHKSKTPQSGEYNGTAEPDEVSLKHLSEPTSCQQTVVGRKRVRLVLSDDENEMDDEVECSAGRLPVHSIDDDASVEFTSKDGLLSSDCKLQDFSPVASKSRTRHCNPINVEESTCSYKSLGPNITSHEKINRSLSDAEVVIGSDCAASKLKTDINGSLDFLDKHNALHLKNTNCNENDGCITFKIDNNLIHFEVSSFMALDKRSIESLKVEIACLYFLQLPVEKRAKGLLPIIRKMECGGRPLESFENFKHRNYLTKVSVDVVIDGWVQKRLMKLYIDSCIELSEAPNMRLLKKLYLSEIEDEISVSECELQDISVIPLLNALHSHRGVAMLDLSHNLLGNGTMEKLQQFFATSNQKYGDLILDLHGNRFGPTALFQICECPVLFTRLEVLNIAGNRLTDSCGSYLLTILEKCKALYSLNIERCSITSRTIQKVADALDTESILSQLLIGYNNPISMNAITNLLDKLATLKRFSDLSLNGIKLSKHVVDGLCRLAKTSCLSCLMLESSGIGTEGAIGLTQSLISSVEEPLKLDLSFCGVASTYIYGLKADDTFISRILELNLGGNPIMPEGGSLLASLLADPKCSLKVLILKKCQLGMDGILHIVQALAENDSLEELNLADNTGIDKQLNPQNDKSSNESSECSKPNHTSELSCNPCVSKEFDGEQGSCAINTDCNMLEVADSEDDEIREKPVASGFDDSCASSCQKNSSFECQYIQELSTAISMVKQLQQLDLSNNGLSLQASEACYTAWSSGSRVSLAWRHIENQTVHLSVEENKCCRVKSCCRKN